MQKSNTMRGTAKKIFKGRQLTIGMDLGDRWSFYCVLEESGRVLLEDKFATTPEAMKQTWSRRPCGNRRWPARREHAARRNRDGEFRHAAPRSQSLRREKRNPKLPWSNDDLPLPMQSVPFS